MSRIGRTFSALRVPNYRAYFIGQTISTIGTWMQMLAQSWLVLDLTHSGRALGLTAALQTLPIALLTAWGGLVADRVDRRKLLMITAVLGAAQGVGIGIMTAAHVITVHWIYLFAVLLGIVGAFDRPAQQAMLYELAGPDELASAVGLNAMTMSTGRLIGPAVAGLVIAVSSTATCFFINAATYAAMVIALLVLRLDQLFRRSREGMARPRIKDGFVYVWARPELRHALIVMFIVGTFAYNFATTMPSMIKFVFHDGAGTLGVAQSASGLGATAGALFVGTLVRPDRRRFGIITFAFGATIAIAAISPNIVAFVLACAPLGVASAMFSATDQLVLQKGTEPEYQGRVMSLFTLAWLGTTPIGALIVGWVIETWSARVGMSLGAIAAVVCGLATVVPMSRSIRHGIAAAPETA